MTSRSTYIILAMLFSLLVLYLSPAGADSKHDGLSCESCHKGDNGHAGVPLPAPDICLSCHPSMKGPGHHPVDIVPPAEMTVPSGLPLADGKVWCSTCHDPHGSEYMVLLRMSAADLCISCHKK